MVELRKYIFRYYLVPAVGARMIGSRDDQEWSEYDYIGDSPEVEATEEELENE